EISHTKELVTVLLELSLKMGMVATHLNREPKYTIRDVLREVDRLDAVLLRSALTKFSDNFLILPGSDQVVTSNTSSLTDILHLINTASEIADVVILDVPSTYDDLFFGVFSHVGHAVLIGEQKVPSIRALKLIHEAMGREQTGQAESVVINRYNNKL